MPRAFPRLLDARFEDEFIVFCEFAPYWMNFIVVPIIAMDADGRVSFESRANPLAATHIENFDPVLAS